jgi:hypothetical protein
MPGYHFPVQLRCQVQLWFTPGASSPDVQGLFDWQSVESPSRQSFLQLVQSVLSAYDLPFAKKAVVTVVSGDEVGRSETYDEVVLSAL